MLHNEQVLDENEVPEHELVLHRQDELTRLSTSMRRSACDLTYLIGPPGTGKTMCARLQVGRRGGIKDPNAAYINCWQYYQRNDILYKVTDEICDAVIHRQSTARSVLLDHLTAEPEEKRFVILDEADQLHDKAIIYDLFECPDLQLILIANQEEDLFGGIDERLRSRLAAAKRVPFEAYTVRQLSEIITKRAEYALRDRSVISDCQLDTIAEQADGDARISIRSLREAVWEAIDNGHRRVQDQDVEVGIDKAVEVLRQNNLDQLNDHQRVVYDIVVEDGPLAPKEIIDRYGDRVDTPRAERTLRTYLSKLTHYNLVKKCGPRRDRTYEALE